MRVDGPSSTVSKSLASEPAGACWGPDGGVTASLVYLKHPTLGLKKAYDRNVGEQKIKSSSAKRYYDTK